MKYRILLPLAALAAGSTVAAESTDSVVVTATRIAQTTDQALVPVSVLTREDIERSAASTLPELLSQLPGIDFSISGGHGKTSSLYLRGTNSEHTLVLIDGVRVGSATLGSFPFEQIALAQIERVEVVRGPRSSLYGAEAIGGVIQIFTRKGHQGAQTDVLIGAGSNATKDVEAAASWGSEKTQASISLGYYDTDGIDALNGDDPDADGYTNKSLGARFDHQLTSDTSISANFLRINSTTRYDSVGYVFPTFIPIDRVDDDYSDNVQQTVGLRFSSDLSDRISLNGGINEHRDHSKNFADLGEDVYGIIKTKRRGVDLKSDFFLGDNHLLTLGLDFYRDQVTRTPTLSFGVLDGNYDETKRNNRALFTQWQGQYGDFSVLAGARHDDNEAYGHHSTGNLNLGYKVAQGHRLLASVGTGFKAPSFNQLYWPGYGNSNLKPEESVSYELGYEGSADYLTYVVRAFQTDVDNLISAQPANKQARMKGIELELAGEFSGWQTSANVALLDAVDRQTGARLTNRSERSLKLNLGRRYGEIDWLMSLLAQGDRIGTGGNTLPGYGLLNLKASYALNKNWRIEAKVNNMTDKDYTTSEDFFGRVYNGLDRSYLLSLAYQR